MHRHSDGPIRQNKYCKVKRKFASVITTSMMNIDNKRSLLFRWGVFAVLVFCLVAKCSIWHLQFFAEKDIPVLVVIWSCLFLASPVLLCKHRPWWFLFVLAAANIWLFANFAYERAWGQMLTMDMVRMAYIRQKEKYKKIKRKVQKFSRVHTIKAANKNQMFAASILSLSVV